MKKLVILISICIMLNSCETNYQLSNEDKTEVYRNLSQLDGLFYPENDNIIFSSRRNIWEFFSGKEISDEERIVLIKKKLKDLESMNVATAGFVDQLYKSLEKNDTVNFGILFTSHEYGDQMLKVLPKREDVYKEDCDDWLGDDEIISMSDEEFSNFLKERLYAGSSKKAVFEVPYIETSLALCQGRKYYNYIYSFVKNKEDKWLLDDIRIEEDKD